MGREGREREVGGRDGGANPGFLTGVPTHCFFLKKSYTVSFPKQPTARMYRTTVPLNKGHFGSSQVILHKRSTM